MKRDYVGAALKCAAIACFVLAGLLSFTLVYSVSVYGVSDRDICETRIWGHCASRRTK